MSVVVEPTGAPADPDRLDPSSYVRFVLVLGALIGLGPLTIDMYLPAFPRIADDLDATSSQVQLTLTGMLLGLAVGQLVIGPLSDMYGRRRPLMVGLAAHALVSLACAVAPTVEVLAGLRLLQGFSGAAISVTAMAMVRDRFEGVAMAHLMARLFLVIGLAPIIAPSLGGLVLAWAGWRSLFHVLALAAVAMLVLAWFALTETLPAERRRPARLRASLAAYSLLLRDGRFLALALIGGAMMSTLFAYIAGASFVLQDGFGLSAGEFALVFGLNAATFVIGSQVNPLLTQRFPLLDVLTGGILLTVAAAASLLALAIADVGGVPGVVVPIAVMLFAGGLSMPNTPALALADHAGEAGTAAAVLGCLQFGIGGVVAPLVGAFGTVTAVPMAVAMLAMGGLAVALVFGVVRRA